MVNNYPGFMDNRNFVLGIKFSSTATRKEKGITQAISLANSMGLSGSSMILICSFSEPPKLVA